MSKVAGYLTDSRRRSGLADGGPGGALPAAAPRAFPLSPARRRAGVSLVELMIAIVILTIGIVGLAGSFKYIQRAMQLSKNKTLASNLAQEKMQILKEKTYYQVIVTSNPAYNDTDFAPETIAYDTGYFPPDTITEGGVTYTRYTYVQALKEDSGVVGEIAPDMPDTGIKRVTVNVVWGYGDGKRKVTMRSIIANPDSVMADVVLQGTITSTNSVALPGALVQVAQGTGWSDTADSLGKYKINSTPGTYTLIASATGYYTQTLNTVIAAGATQTNNFSLSRIATGNITGYAWIANHPVISQVVDSTVMVNGVNVEYVELYNPTTWTMNISDGAGGNNIKLRYIGETGMGRDVNEFALTYISTFVAPGKYFLIASASTMTVYGVYAQVDAVFSAANSPPCTMSGGVANCLRGGEAGAVQLLDSANNVLDTVGWTHGAVGKGAPAYEGTALVQYNGFPTSQQLRRTSEYQHTTAGNGRAYDSNNNTTDFEFIDFTNVNGSPPCGTDSGVFHPVTATPASGGVVTSADGLSAFATVSATGYYFLNNVATGTWTVMVSSSVYGLSLPSVNFTAGVTNSYTSDSGFLNQILSSGTISGRVKDTHGAPLGNIAVTSGGANTTHTGTTGAQLGYYSLTVNPGTQLITANPSVGGTASYVTLSSAGISIDVGEAHGGVDFVLYQGARVSGCVTRDSTNGLPGIAVAIIDDQAVARDIQVTGTDGCFTSVVLSTGYYSVQPSIDPLESSSPTVKNVTLTGGTTSVGSFIISGAMGFISGTVKASGQAIKSGVLIVITTSTLSGTPPAPPDISSTTMFGPPYYIVSSLENGTYQAEVKNSTNPAYNVYAYYPVAGSTGTVVQSTKTANVQVVAGSTTWENFSW